MKRPLSLCVAQNADIRLGNTRKIGKLLKHPSSIWMCLEQNRMPKKEKPMTKKERDEKRKAKKEHKSKVQS
jgi:hypothetical protein